MMPLLRLAAFALAAVVLPLASAAAATIAEGRQSFDLPAGDAPATLRLFSERSGREVLFVADMVRGVRTNAVHGEFGPREALDRMLAGTTLVAVADERSGALAVKRREREPPATPPPKKSTAVAPAAREASASVVKLEEFKVTTTLGSYEETTTSVAAKTPLAMKDIPATVQVLNAAFIDDKRAQSLEDLYPYIVGMTRESPAALGFTLRGFSNNLTNTLLNNVQTDGLPGLASRFGSPTTANVERVEVLKGPASVLYGSMNPGGIINIVTKQPLAQRSGNFYGTVASFAGHDSGLGRDVSVTSTLDVSGPLDARRRWLYRFITSYEDVSGFRQFSWGRNHYFFPSLTFRADENTEVTLKVDVTRQHRFSDQYLVAPFKDVANVAAHDVVYQDRNNTEYDRGDIYALTARHRSHNDWTFRLNLRDVQHVDGRNPLENRAIAEATPLVDSTVLQRWRDTWNRRRYAYLDANLSREFGPENFRHTLLLGANAGYESHDFVRWVFANLPGGVNVYRPVHDVRPLPYASYDPTLGPSQDAVAKYYNLGGYVSDQVKIGPRLRASFGVHYEGYDTSYVDHAPVTQSKFTHRSRSFVPSAGLVYQPREALALYASYGESFKPSQPQNVDQNRRGLPPEIAQQWEVGAKSDWLEGQLGVLLSLYDIHRKRVSEAVPLVFLPNNVQLHRLIGQQRSRGVELSLNYQPVPHWQTQVGYTYLDARTTASLDPALIGARVANAPRQSANFWTRYNFPVGALRGFGLGLGVVHVGERAALLPSTDDPRTMPIASSTRVDLAVYYRWRRYDFALNATNLTDLSYIASADSEVDVVPGAPRKLTASLHYTF
jgi:iron complex outermembrane receptor protein